MYNPSGSYSLSPTVLQAPL